MRTLSIGFALLGLAVFGIETSLAQDARGRSWLESGNARPAAPAPTAPSVGVTQFGKTAAFNTYASRNDFNADFAGGSLEDFASPLLTDGVVAGCLPLINSTTDGPCYPAGELLPNAEYTFFGPDDGGLIGVGPGIVPVVSGAVGPDFWEDNLLFTFDPPIEAAGFDVGDFGIETAGMLDIVVFDTNGDSIVTSLSPGIDTWTFFGVSSSNLITQIKVSDDPYGEAAELIDDLNFLAPPGPPSLTAPADNATNVPLTTELTWSPQPGTAESFVEVATDANFNTIVFEQNTSESKATFTTSAMGTQHWWRVQAVGVSGATSAFSSASTFTTLAPAPIAPLLVSPSDGATDVALTTTLDWDAADNASEYGVEVALDQGFSNIVKTETTANTQASFTTDQGGTQFWWRVKSIGPGGESDFATPFSYTTLIPPPSVPTLVSPANNATDVPLEVDLEWVESANAESYQVQVSTDEGFGSIVLDETTSGTEQPFATDLAGTPFWWRVRATGPGGESGFSSAFRFTTLNPVPARPELVSPEDGATDVPETIELTWLQVDYADRYQVQVSENQNFTQIIFNENVPDTVSEFTGGRDGEQFFWRVQAQGPGGNSPFSVTFDFTHVILPPDAVTLVAPTNGADDVPTSTTLQWNETANTDEYRVTVATDGDLSDVVYSDTTDQISSAFVAPQAGGSYHWQVTAVSPGGLESKSAVWQFDAGATGALVPVALMPPDGAVQVEPDAQLSWEPPAGGAPALYHVQVSADTGFEDLVVDDSVDGLSLSLDSLPAATQFSWRVGGIDGAGNRTFSLPQTFTTVEDAPGLVLLTRPTDVSSGVPILTEFLWTELDEAQVYHIQVSTTADFGSTASFGSNGIAAVVDEDSTLTGGSYTVSTPLANATLHYWRVRAGNTGGWGEWTEPWSFTTVGGVATESDGLPAEFALGQNYPNPFDPGDGAVSIEFTLPETSDVALTVFDGLGRPVKALVAGRMPAGHHRVTWTADDAVSGIYYYRLDAGSFSNTRTMMLVR